MCIWSLVIFEAPKRTGGSHKINSIFFGLSVTSECRPPPRGGEQSIIKLNRFSLRFLDHI